MTALKLLYLGVCAVLFAMLYLSRAQKLAEEPDARPMQPWELAVLSAFVFAWPLMAFAAFVGWLIAEKGVLDSVTTTDKDGR